MTYPSDNTTIPLKELKKHRNETSCWLVIHNDVYDVTAFLNEHPGGADSLIENAGMDATTAFEDVGHSEDAREIMKKYKIGRLAPEEHIIFVEPCCRSKKLTKGPSCPVVQKNVLKPVKSRSPGSPSRPPSRSKTKLPPPLMRSPPVPKTTKPVDVIIVPKKSNKWKWILLALGAAIVTGIVIKKYSG